MRRDLNVKFYVGKEEEASQLKNVGDFFRAEDTGALLVVGPDGVAAPLGGNSALYSARLSSSGTLITGAALEDNRGSISNQWERLTSGNYRLFLSTSNISNSAFLYFNKGITTFQENINAYIEYDALEGGTYARVETFGGTEPLDDILDQAFISINIL